MEEEKIVLIDTDAGTDDAWAIFMCLAAHRDPYIPFKVVGLTCVTGNIGIDNVTRNVTRTLQTVGEENIPIFRGSETALVFPYDLGDNPYFGKDGFGDTNLPPVQPKLEAEHAVHAIIRLAELYKGKLTILTMGPLTNLATAVRLKPEIKHWIKDLYILGGNYKALGDTTAVGEFNVLADAEAAHIVLENFSSACHVHNVPWETCVSSSSTTAFREKVLGKINSNEMHLLNKIEAKRLEIDRPTGIWFAPDTLASAVLIESTLVTRSKDYYCTVEVSGKYCRGMTVVDKAFIEKKPPNCTIVEKVDVPLFERMLIWAAGGPYYKEWVKRNCQELNDSE
ncbi:unnamed protein product [Allacma fusca]|uniref:Inosine/uridine-preferring nucleoside hydrolase domain-containing protein n=1 Tax=Allacma fusca TaxID=39272 RepID=A0A8J2KY71_9HEXA|nr:unnamed protein product [Allacma fusca]